MTRLLSALAFACCALALQACDDDCNELEQEAREFRDAAAACSAGDTCALVDMYQLVGDDTCLLAFQCTHALDAATDLDVFRRGARRIADDYDGCPQCVIADCVDPSSLVARCDEAQGKCVAEMREVGP